MTTITLDRLRRAGRILRAFVEQRRHRLAYAARSRNALQKKLQAGQPIEGPRATWIAATANRVGEVLAEARDRYEGRYPWDAVTLDDLRDVLNTAMHAAKKEDEE